VDRARVLVRAHRRRGQGRGAPASTLVQVSALFRDDLLIEVEALAAVPSTT
jgi:enamine deaminase RidA (YjgF/YER057c/UK114 family)